MQTMTVAQLRQKLSEYADDLPVWATWEGVLAYVQDENFMIERHDKDLDQKRDCLVIDVETY